MTGHGIMRWLEVSSSRCYSETHFFGNLYNTEARRWGTVYHDIHRGADLEAPANPVNLRLNEIQTDIRVCIDELFEVNDKLHLKASEMWQPHNGTPTAKAPEVTILPTDVPTDVEELPVTYGGIPVDDILIGRGKEEVEEALARAEGAKTHDEL